MRAFLVGAFIIALPGCSRALPASEIALAQSVAVPEADRQDGVETALFKGPGLVCGISFATVLMPDEQILRFDQQMDFVTYRLTGPDRAAVIYEGNAPQKADVLIKTGGDFPSVVSLHLDPGGYDRSLARRILTKDEILVACASAKR